MDWRGTNGIVSLNYASLGYAAKNAPFETVDELRLVYGADSSLLVGEDLNRNGVLDKNEKDLNSNGELDPGLFEYVTVYTREPNFHADGSSLTNVSTRRRTAQIQAAACKMPSISTSLRPHPIDQPGPYHRHVGLCAALQKHRHELGRFRDIFRQHHHHHEHSTSRNRVNVNTANADVLTALFMGLNVDESTAESAAQTLVTYRQQNPGQSDFHRLGD